MSEAQQYNIRLSNSALKIGILSTALAVLCICIFVTILFMTSLNFGSSVETAALLFLWLSLPLMLAVGSLGAVMRKRNTRYTLTENSLIVRYGNIFGSSKEVMYRYDSILSVESDQSKLGNIYGYGDVRIAVPRLNEPVILRGIKIHINKQSK